MGVDAVAPGQGNRLEAHNEKLGLGISQRLGQTGKKGGGVPKHPVKAGVVGGSGEKVAVGLGEEAVTPAKVEAEQNDYQSDGEKLAIGGLLLRLPGQAKALGRQPLERVVYPDEGGDDQVRKVSPTG